MKSKYVIFKAVISLFASSTLTAQDPFPSYAPIYKDDVIGRVDITLPPDRRTSWRLEVAIHKEQKWQPNSYMKILIC